MEKTLDTTTTAIFALIASLFAFLGLNQVQFIILIVLMSLDIITGIAKAYRVDRTSVRSDAFKLGTFSKFFYLCVPFVVALVAKGTMVDSIGVWLASFAVTILILSEGYSILGNIYSFKTGKVVHEVDGVSYLLIFIRKMIKKLLEEKIDG
jgi:phage-related holin